MRRARASRADHKKRVNPHTTYYNINITNELGVLTKELGDLAVCRVQQDRTKSGGMMTDMLLNEVDVQFGHMAQGGDGSRAEMGNIREEYYPGAPNRFFQLVCEMMGWDYTNRK